MIIARTDINDLCCSDEHSEYDPPSISGTEDLDTYIPIINWHHDPCLQDNQGMTVAMIAAEEGKLEILS